MLLFKYRYYPDVLGVAESVSYAETNNGNISCYNMLKMDNPNSKLYITHLLPPMSVFVTLTQGDG